ncbi:hypothetical protein [Archaeoglobus sp.]
MLRLKKGQWYLIFALVFAFSVIALSVTLSELSKYGTFVSNSVYDIPYYEIRSLITEITRAFRSGDWNFTSNNSSFIENATYVYAVHGIYVNFTNLSVWSNGYILRINFSLRTDKVTFYVDKNVSR